MQSGWQLYDAEWPPPFDYNAVGAHLAPRGSAFWV